MYIMDADSFINAYRINYPFDLFPSYWDKLAIFTQQSLISINASIYNELAYETDEDMKDALQKWIEDEFKGEIIKKDQAIVNIWAEIINHVETSACYKRRAFIEWADEDVADPWIIATAKVNKLTVVTNEQKNIGLNKVNPSKSAKIRTYVKTLMSGVSLYEKCSENLNLDYSKYPP